MLSVQRQPVFLRGGQSSFKQAASLSLFFIVQNAYLFLFFSDIYKNKSCLMNDVKRFISCFLANARSTIDKMDELGSYVYALKKKKKKKKKPDLITITE